MDKRCSMGIFSHFLVLSILLCCPAEARLFDAANVLTERTDAAVAGDLDGDGVEDIVLFREGYSDEGFVGVCFGRGDGTFQDPVDYSVGEVGYVARASLVIGDLDEDGDLDLAVLAYLLYSTRSDIWVILNNGDGTFAVGDHYQAAFCAEDMKIVDLDGNGLHDLAVVHSDCGGPGQDGWLSVLLGRGDGTFVKALLHDLDFEPSSLAAGDFNGDCSQDLVLNEFINDMIMVLPGNGDGTFQSGVEYPVGEHPFCVAAGDLNADGWLDLAVANYRSDTVSVLMGLGDGSFRPAEHVAVAATPFFVEISDIDNDQIPDLMTTSFRSNGEDVSILKGDGDGTFQDALLVETGDYTEFGASTTDFDGDGILDILAENGGGLSVVLGHGDGTFTVAPSTNAFPGNYSVDAGDVNGDGNPDIVMPAADLKQVHEEVVVLLGRGDGTFGSKVSAEAGYKFDSVVVGDLNQDGLSDVISWMTNAPFITILLGQRDGGLQEIAMIDVDYPRSIAMDDLDADGNVDLVVVARHDGYLLLGQGDGSFEPAMALGLGYYRGSCDTGDLNLDGNPDLVVAYTGGSSIQVLLGNGDGTFAAPMSVSVSQPESVALGDLNEDGHPDLAVIRQYGILGALFGNGDGSFQKLVELDYPNVESPRTIEHTGDLDLDGHVDLVIVCLRWVAVLLGNGDGSFRPFVYGIEESAYFNFVAMDDLDNDGDLDLVASGGGDRFRISVLINNSISKTISGDYTISPLSGTLPFMTNHQVYLRNLIHGSDSTSTRSASVSIDVQIGDGIYYSNWRAGYTNLSPNEVLIRNWSVLFPADPTLAGTNSFFFQVVDTTPAPWNQPPYPPSGDTATRVRSVVAALP